MKLLTLLPALLFPVLSFAGTITFDEFGAEPAPFETGKPVNDLYASQGIYFRGANASKTNGGVILNDSTFTVKAYSGHDFLAFSRIPETDGGDGYPVGPEVVTFSTAVNHVSIEAASLDARGGTFSLAAFDAQGAAIDSDVLQLSAIHWGQLSVDGSGISKVVFNETTTANTFVFDDLNYQATPEPGSMGCFGLGFDRDSEEPLPKSLAPANSSFGEAQGPG